MNELEENINKFGNGENYYNHLLAIYGHTEEQQKKFIQRTHTPEMQAHRGRLGGLANTKEKQSLKGKLGGINNTSLQQSIKGIINTSEQQSLKGKIGGKNNTSKQQSIKGKKSGQIRFEGSNEQLKPWESLGISRRTYYYREKVNSKPSLI